VEEKQMQIDKDVITLSVNLKELVLLRNGLLALKETGLPGWYGYAARDCETGACKSEYPPHEHDCRGTDQKLLDELDNYLHVHSPFVLSSDQLLAAWAERFGK